MGILEAAGGAVTGEPGGELPKRHFPALRHMDALQVLLKGEEIDVLLLVAVVVGVIERAGVVHQVG